MPNNAEDFYIVVDIETAGPNPSQYSLLSIGACTLSESQETFYTELKPDKDAYVSEALQVSQFTMAELVADGTHPKDAMEQFSHWIEMITPRGSQPVFVAFNAPFDWMFINDYFHRYVGANPFGYKALDIKAFYMGLKGVPWAYTSHKYISHNYLYHPELPHHALQDAILEAELFAAILQDWQQLHIRGEK
jgi:DNA polymerase III epsilon subunit-like protein